MSNFFGFPKPRKAGFGSADIPSGDVPLDTTNEEVVLEGVIVDFGEAGRKVKLRDFGTGVLDPFVFEGVDSRVEGEDINSFLLRMMGVDSPVRNAQDDVSGTILIDEDAVENTVKVTGDKISAPSVQDAESVEDMLKVMGNENEKLQNFITDAMKNIKK